MKYRLVAILSVAILLLPIVNGSLNVSVSIENPEIHQSESQKLTVTANERGIGVLLVIQPSEGTPWMDFLEDHPSLEKLWNLLPNSMRTKIVDKVGDKIVSYKIVKIGTDGGNSTVTFPEDFVGINGKPSTVEVGEYKAILAFLSCQKSDGYDCKCCCLFEVDFDCVSWPVIPEFPSAPLLLVLFAIIAAPLIKLRRKILTEEL
jgi:hypothetical protein